MGDEELAGRATHDPLAFGEIYERYVDRVYGYCHRRLGSKERAEDATSLIFSRALAAIDRFQPRSTVRSWLFTIAHNVITDQYRTSGRVQVHALDDDWDVTDTDPLPDEVVISAEARDTVHDLMTGAALPTEWPKRTWFPKDLSNRKAKWCRIPGTRTARPRWPGRAGGIEGAIRR